MIKYIYTLALFVGLANSFLQGQNFTDGAVTSFKADFYKDFTYTDINNGVPDGTPIKLEITEDSWGDNISVGSYPNNSLTPTEITTKRGVTIALNDGVNHNFHAMPIGSTDAKTGLNGGNRGIVLGYGKLPTNEIVNFRNSKSPQWFLTSGKYGMDLATAVANINEGLPDEERKLEFGSFIVDSSKIKDDKPDFLFTQVADPGDSDDIMYFIDGSGERVGEILRVNFSSEDIPDLGGAQRNIRYIEGGKTKPLKMIAFEFNDFNIERTDANRIKKLIYIPSGNSDPAFVAADRNSVFVYKGISGLIKVTGNENDIKKENEIIKIIQGSSAGLELIGVSESGQGPFELTYKINGVPNVKRITGNKINLSIETSTLTTHTFELVSVKDERTGNTQNIENQKLTVKIISPICRNEKPNLTGNAANSKVAISTLNRSGNDISLENLGAYLVLESTKKGFVITRNIDPENNITPAKEGMIVWDTNDNCLKIFNDREDKGTPQWNCIKKVEC